MRVPSRLLSGLAPVVLMLVSCVAPDAARDAAPAGPSFLRAAAGPAVTDAASTGGAGWVDYDGDGDLDLCVTNGYDVSAEEAVPQPNRLYRNDGGGMLTPVTEGDFPADEGFSSGQTWGDYDNDGDLDLFVANQLDQDNFLYRNDGGALVRVTDGVVVGDGGHSYASAWVDVDADGHLDLFVPNGGMSHTGPNFLYRNRGDGTFEKITEGEIVTDEAATCGFGWGDYDGDGDLDLFAANQGFSEAVNANAIYRNEGGWRFAKVSGIPAVEHHRPSCAADWVDIDNDGDLDLYVSNMYGLANDLYRNDGGGGLEPVEDDPAALGGGHTYETCWGDFDNDGDLDLVTGNWGAAAELFLNDGAGGFARSDAGDLGRRIEYAATMSSGDYDGDGDLDLYIGNWPNRRGPGELNSLYVNQGSAGRWLQVKLVGTESNRSGLGARVIVTARINGDTLRQSRDVWSHAGFRSQTSLVQHFGLGDAERVDEVEVRWPSGRRSRLESVSANQVLTITEN